MLPPASALRHSCVPILFGALLGLGHPLPAQATATAPADPRATAAAWSEDEIAELRQVLAEAPRHALSAQAYLSRLENADDATLTRTALAYASALSSGIINPRELHAIFELETNAVDVSAGLAIARASGRLGPWLRSLAPQDATYGALSAAYLRELDEALHDPQTEIPAGPVMRIGARDARLPLVVKRLRSRGLLEDEATAPLAYDAAVAAAVRRLQRETGLEEDGIIGADTLAELNRGPVARAQQLAVNLERRRWLARRPPPTRIDVNTAFATLTYLRRGEVQVRARIVAGAAGRETPLLQESFDTLVVNPPWYVPASIANTEILPKGAAYLRAHDMDLRDGRVIQRPGPDAALGRVKFDMRNRYAIYLHDTPAKALFETSRRHRSHGCVRVEDAVGFARRLADERARSEAFDDALASGETRTVSLGEELPVRLLYLSARVEPDGRVELAQDVYGWDRRLAAAMGLTPVRARAALPPPADLLGP